MRRTWPFVVAVTVVAAGVGVFLARPDERDGFRLGESASAASTTPGDPASATTVLVASMAPVPRSTIRVVVIGAGAVAVVDRMQSLGYSAALMAVDDDATPGLFAAPGFDSAAQLVASDLARNDPVSPLADSGAAFRVVEDTDVLLVLGA